MQTFEPIIGAEYSQKLVELLDQCKQSVDLVCYDWRWYPNQPGHKVQQFNNAVVRAVNRGVIVRAVLNSKELIPLLQKLGVHARRLKDRRVVHSKLIIIDRELLIIGSHNFSRNAFGSNIETSLLVSIPKEVNRFHEFFENLFQI
jgi:phosphatidylserine/phosphatidylglycerophosphate/cardiolipin synthase-like enzyme